MFNKQDKFLVISLVLLPFMLVIGVVAVVFLNNNTISKQTNKEIDREIEEKKVTKNIWLIAEQKTLKANQILPLNVFINTSNSELGAFAFDFKFDKNIFIVATSSGDNGISKGDNAKNYLLMSNPNDVVSGHLRFSGICAQNCAQGNNQHIAVIYIKVLTDFVLPINVNWLETKELSDIMGHPFVLNNFQGNKVIK